MARRRLLVFVAFAALVCTTLVGSRMRPVAAQVPVPPVGGLAEVPRVLVFSATYGFRHPVIPKSNALIAMMGQSTGAYNTDVSENPRDINAENLAKYDVLVFNHTAGKTPLTAQQREEMVRFVACGGGFAGLGMAEDSNYAWPEYTELIGANAVTHELSEGTAEVRFNVEDQQHPITANAFGGVDSFTSADEVYLHRMDPRRLPYVHTLVSMDTATVPASIQSGPNAYWEDQPVAWTSNFRGGGRTFATTFGHGDVAWDAAWFRSMVYESIVWTAAHPVDRECAAGDDPLPAPAAPPAPDPAQVGRECPLPTTGPYRSDGRLFRLTEEGVGTAMPVGIPFTIFPDNNRYVLDLSATGASTADLTLRLDWQGAADFDLGITLPWGFAGSSLTQPVNPAGEPVANGEEVILDDIPTCADIMVAAEHFWSIGHNAGHGLEPTLTITVNAQPEDPPSPPPQPPPAAGPGPIVLATPGGGSGLFATFVPVESRMAAGATLSLANTDPQNVHNIVSNTKDAAGQPVFRSAYAGAGDVVPVEGTNTLPPGAYGFVCALHPMTGTLTVQ